MSDIAIDPRINHPKNKISSYFSLNPIISGESARAPTITPMVTNQNLVLGVVFTSSFRVCLADNRSSPHQNWNGFSAGGSFFGSGFGSFFGGSCFFGCGARFLAISSTKALNPKVPVFEVVCDAPSFAAGPIALPTTFACQRIAH
jgi:hypothetical protein